MEGMTNRTANGDPTKAPREGARIESDNWRKLGKLLFSE